LKALTLLEIKKRQEEYYVYWDRTDEKAKLKYEENTPTNEQIWTLRQNGKKIGDLILQNDYSSGRYMRYSDNQEFHVKKIE